MTPHRVIPGHDGPIEFDDVNRTVTKTYLNQDHRIATRKAEREATHLARLFDALVRVDGVYCPRLLASDASSPPRVVMTLCPGELLALPGRSRTLFIIAGAVYVGGALGMEMAVGAYLAAHGHDLTYGVLSTLEEVLEMAGIVVFLYGLMDHLERHAPESRIRIVA